MDTITDVNHEVQGELVWHSIPINRVEEIFQKYGLSIWKKDYCASYAVTVDIAGMQELALKSCLEMFDDIYLKLNRTQLLDLMNDLEIEQVFPEHKKEGLF